MRANLFAIDYAVSAVPCIEKTDLGGEEWQSYSVLWISMQHEKTGHLSSVTTDALTICARKSCERSYVILEKY